MSRTERIPQRRISMSSFATSSTPSDPIRAAFVRRGLHLNYFGIGYNVLEAAIAVAAGLAAGSVALVGFGLDSVIEVTASGAAQWRLRSDLDLHRRERVERRTARIIGWSFLALALYVAIDSASALAHHDVPERSLPGLVLLALSAVVMPVLARAKRRVARALASGALEADAMQTSLCAYLSVIALAGVALNAFVGWWWADPVAALAMVPIIAREGVEGVRREVLCADDCR
jgi:divalent metal cation (Fe/Co/Zn/Cd) transporter